jgi:hypothetical protein
MTNNSIIKKEWLRYLIGDPNDQYLKGISFDHHITLTYPDATPSHIANEILVDETHLHTIPAVQSHGRTFVASLQKKKKRGQISSLQVIEVKQGKAHIHLLTYRTRAFSLKQIESTWTKGIAKAKGIDSETYRRKAIHYVFKDWWSLNEDQILERFDFNNLPKRKKHSRDLVRERHVQLFREIGRENHLIKPTQPRG